jgi:lipopolysaccharide biosynthesis glycosyltransferase
MSEKIIITVCSINYLAQAKALADSVIHHNPGYKLVIGLVDKINDQVDITSYAPHRLLQVHEMNLPEFEEMYNRYNLLELNCALKSFFVRWGLDTYKPEYLFYLDADMMVHDSLASLEELLNQYSILVTPHITKPFPRDNLLPAEHTILKTGMYNAGFFAVKNDVTGNALINWWKERMVDEGYERPKDGYNCDQNWLNFAPLYFAGVKNVDHPGCNVAYWNFHEKDIEKRGEKVYVNNQPLLIFHYSGYSIKHPGEISRHQTRYSMKYNAAIESLFKEYHQVLLNNGHAELQKIPCYYKKESSGLLKKLGLKK